MADFSLRLLVVHKLAAQAISTHHRLIQSCPKLARGSSNPEELFLYLGKFLCLFILYVRPGAKGTPLLLPRAHESGSPQGVPWTSMLDLPGVLV